MQVLKYRYVIVGAGISGLVAARILAEHNEDFVIIEAGDRIGGRICTLTVGQVVLKDKIQADYPWLTKEIRELPIETGATWLSAEQPVITKMVKQFGLTLFEHSYVGNKVLAVNPHQYLPCPQLGDYYNNYKPKILKLLGSLKKLEHRFEELGNLKRVGLISGEQEKQLGEMYAKYDTMSAYDFIHQEVEDKFLGDLLANEAATLQCARAQDYSVLTLMADEGEPLANVKFYIGEQDSNIDGFRLKEGNSTIVACVKNSIQKAFDKNGKNKNIDDLIWLNTPVTEVRNGSQPVEVVTEKGQVVTCEKMLVALPIATLGQIKFGEISKGKKAILDSQLHNVMARQAMIFKTPFWRKLGFSGYVSFSHQFAMNELVDLSPSQQECGVLGFVFTADGLAKWRAQIAKECQGLEGQALRAKQYEVNKTLSAKILADMFFKGDIHHESLQQFVLFTRTFKDNPYIRAAYQASTPTGVYKQVYDLGEDFATARAGDEKNVVLLGSDFADEFSGYMEGAIRIAESKVRKMLGVAKE